MVSLVSAYHNKEDLTVNFLDNLKRVSPGVKLYLTNAGSKPIEHPYIFKRTDLDKNESFSNSMNASLKIADGDFVCVLGNDVFPDALWLDELVNLAKRTGAMITCPLNDKTIMSQYATTKQNEDYYEPDFFPAVCWLLSRECIGKVGLFDERFKLGTYEDNDYARRVQNAGGKTVVSKKVVVRHLLSQTMNQFDIQKAMHDNYDRFVDKWK